MEIDIRPVGSDAMAQLLAVYQACEDFLALGPIPFASEAMILADLDLSRREGGEFCGIYLPTGEMVGVVDAVQSGYEGDVETAFLSLLMIIPRYRGVGIGERVVQRVESAIRQDPSVRRIRSAVQVNNPMGLRFWQRMGYRIYGGPQYNPDETTVYLLKKSL